ncbi:hypothetical protein EDB86DRAFT_1535730 [Lactarius hatsudake]|nr:hypothetical protein EDB86DRAFT_1535730 [Lactarius hatsudake]
MLGCRGHGHGCSILSYYNLTGHQPNNLFMSSDRGLVTVFFNFDSLRFSVGLVFAQPANLMPFILLASSQASLPDVTLNPTKTFYPLPFHPLRAQPGHCPGKSAGHVVLTFQVTLVTICLPGNSLQPNACQEGLEAACNTALCKLCALSFRDCATAQANDDVTSQARGINEAIQTLAPMAHNSDHFPTLSLSPTCSSARLVTAAMGYHCRALSAANEHLRASCYYRALFHRRNRDELNAPHPCVVRVGIT